MKFKVWQNADATETLVQPADRDPLPHFPPDDSVILLREIEADTFELAMEEHHRLMGWEPYK